MKLLLPILTLATASVAHSAIVAQFDFDPDNLSGTTVDTDASPQTNWSTSVLLDNATGTGALSASNQSGTNRAMNTTLGATGNMLNFSSARESDAQTPLASGGNDESTWLSFTITPGVGATLDFTGDSATVDTYANHPSGLGGTVKADWTLYFSTNGGTSWTSLGTQTGAGTTGSNQFPGPVALTWSLTAIGSQTSAIDFIIDPVSTGSTNGNVTQRGVSMDNLIVNADITVVPEPSSILLGSLGILTLLHRRKSR